MQKNIYDNLCTRCGKQRVEVKVTYEKYGDSVLEIRQTACPDPDCQKKVDSKLESERRKREKLISEKNTRSRWQKKEKTISR